MNEYETEKALKIGVYATKNNEIIIRDNINFAKKYDTDYDEINHFTGWPVVYIIYNKNMKNAYVGETTDLKTRLIQHYNSKEKELFSRNGNTRVLYIDYKEANRSFCLQLEHNLIQYMDPDSIFDLKNGNDGIIRTGYYGEDKFDDLFKEIWDILFKLKMVSKEHDKITKELYFEYSPFLALNNEQYLVVKDIVDEIVLKNKDTVAVRGSAGTGKTAIAIHLLKSFYYYTRVGSNTISEEMLGESIEKVYKIKKYFNNKKDMKIGIILPAANLNATLSKYIKKMLNIKRTKDIIYSPNEAVDEYINSGKPFDILIVDEAQSLVVPDFTRQNRAKKAYLERSSKLKLKVDNQLEWVYKISKKRIFFYDITQRIRKGSIDYKILESKFKNLEIKELTVQERCIQAGIEYINVLKEIFNEKTVFTDEKIEKIKKTISSINKYEFINYKNAFKMANDIRKNNGLILSGYSWPSKEEARNIFIKENNLVEKFGKYDINTYKKYYEEFDKHDYFDVVIGEYKTLWNGNGSWVNKPTAPYETGCVYVVGGLNLEYAGVIIGNELKLNDKNMLEFVHDNFKDDGGKYKTSKEELLEYVLNVYYILLTRGRYGTYIYAMDPKLQELFEKIMKTR